MKGFARFQMSIIDAAQQEWMPLVDEHREELGETVKNHLFDLDGPKQLSRQPNSREQYFVRVFRGFSEISKSLDTLDDIAFYIRRFPFTRTVITPDRYLQFHIEAHYSEIYILKERLASYIKIFRRQFRRDPQLPNVESRCEALIQVINKALNGVVELRGRHIHEMRFSDEHIDRLSTIGLLSHGSNAEFSELMTRYYKEEYKRVRKIWRDRTRDNVKSIRELINAFFDALFPMVFEPKTNVLRIPYGIRT